MEKLAKEPNPMNIPLTFRHLDLAWKPLLRVTLPKSEPGGDHSPTKFSIAEKHGDKRIRKRNFNYLIFNHFNLIDS